MKSPKLRKFKALFLISARGLWRRRDFILRAGIAWLIAFGFFHFDRQENIDSRLKMRAPQEISSKIVVIDVGPEEWLSLKRSPISFPKFNTYPKVPDRFFWNAKIWNHTISKILLKNPKSILVSMNFTSSNIRSRRSFLDPKVQWLSPKIVAGEVDLDRVFRRANPTIENRIHLTQIISQYSLEKKNKPIQDIKLINFRGKSGTFPHIKLSDFLSGRAKNIDFDDKIIIIGARGTADHMFITPLGNMSRAEIYANTIDNFVENRWVKKSDIQSFGFLLLFLVILSAWITLQYPQILTVVTLSFFLVGIIAVSLFIFDFFYLLIPIPAQVVAVAGSFMIFMSYQLTLTDHKKDQLEKEKKFLIDVEELKHNFLSLISHDLKTPIAKIQGITDRILAQKVDDNIVKEVGSLRSEAEHLNRYIKTLLQVTRAESHGFQLNPDSMDINEVIENVCSELSTLAQAKAIEMQLKLEPMFLIEADPLLMHEVLLNLAENAIKFSPEGGTVKLSSHEVDGQVIVMVEDEGSGIEADEVSHIFDKFYQGKKGKSYSKGSGLGLYLVKYFIERHNGTVLVQSKPNQGTQIGFSLPINTESANVQEREVSNEANA